MKEGTYKTNDSMITKQMKKQIKETNIHSYHIIIISTLSNRA